MPLAIASGDIIFLFLPLPDFRFACDLVEIGVDPADLPGSLSPSSREPVAVHRRAPLFSHKPPDQDPPVPHRPQSLEVER